MTSLCVGRGSLALASGTSLPLGGRLLAGAPDAAARAATAVLLGRSVR